MKFKKELILISIVSIVFLAGCTGGGGETSAGTGIIIKSFAPDLPTVDGSSDVTFTTVLQNVGGKLASNIKVLFFGLSSDWTDSPGAKFASKLDNSITSLAPADPTSGLKGEEGSADLTLKAPAGKGSDVTYDASVRVYYNYTTISDTLLRFTTQQYAKTSPNVQKGVISSTTTSGPFVITATARTPTISATSKLGRVQFEIQNVGGGRVYNGGLDGANNPKGLDFITLVEISGVGYSDANNRGSCAGQSAFSDGKVMLTLTNVGDTSVRLAAGKSKIISCDVYVGSVTNFQDVALTVNLAYSYFVDSATSVTVLRALQ